MKNAQQKPTKEQRQSFINDFNKVSQLSSSEARQSNINQVLGHEHPKGAIRAFYFLLEKGFLKKSDAQNIFSEVMAENMPFQHAQSRYGDVSVTTSALAALSTFPADEQYVDGFEVVKRHDKKEASGPSDLQSPIDQVANEELSKDSNAGWCSIS